METQDSTEVKKAEDSMESLIRKATMERKQTWAVEEFNWGKNEKRYGWVQCDRGLTVDECGRCWHGMLDTYPQCCQNGTKVQWAVFGPSCAVRFDDQKFYQNSGNIINCVISLINKLSCLWLGILFEFNFCISFTVCLTIKLNL